MLALFHDWNTGAEATRTAGYHWCPEASRGTGSYDQTSVAGQAGLGDLGGTIGQYVSHGHTKPFTRNSGRAGLDPFGASDSRSQ